MDRRINIKISPSGPIDNPTVAGLIIAAGLSSRMGKFKPLIEWEGKTFLSSIIDKLKMVSNNITIITGNESEKLEKYVSEYYNRFETEIKCVNNPIYLKGMFTSLKKGIAVSQNPDWILYHQVDQPNLPQEFYNNFIKQIDKRYDWIQPRYNGKNGHPILLGQKIINKIVDSNNDNNLRLLSSESDISKNYWECKYPEILTDIDTEKDLVKIKREKND